MQRLCVSNEIFCIQMASLCPHLFQEYLRLVSEILETYRPQILVLVHYQVVAEGLIQSRVLRKRENAEILKMEEKKDQVERLLSILKTRMWGLENFITALIEKKVDGWLAQELFGAYVRHLVTRMKELETQKICSCFHGGSNSVIYRSWLQVLTKFDGWLCRVGGSLGFLTLTMHPVKSVLSFISERLPLPKKQILTTNPETDSDSATDEETPGPDTSSVYGSRCSLSSEYPNPRPKMEDPSLLQRCISTPSLGSKNRPGSGSIRGIRGPTTSSTQNDVFDDAGWNGPKVLRPASKKPEPTLLPPCESKAEAEGSDEFNSEPDYDQTRTVTTKSKATSGSWTESDSEEDDELLAACELNWDWGYSGKEWDSTVLQHPLAETVSAGTQTTPPSSPVLGRRSNSVPDAASSADDEAAELDIESEDVTTEAPEAVEESAESVIQNSTPGSSAPPPKSPSKKAVSRSKTTPPVSPTVRTPTFTIRKPSSLTSKSGTKSTPAPGPKVATITPRQRALEAIRAKKANATLTSSPVHEDSRLKPENYSSQQWSNEWARRNATEGSGNVA